MLSEFYSLFIPVFDQGNIAGGGFSIAVSIACERKNVYALRAKIPPNSGEEIARQFTEIMADAEANLREVLGIKE